MLYRPDLYTSQYPRKGGQNLLGLKLPHDATVHQKSRRNYGEYNLITHDD
jgi:hypothetical protein